MTPGDRVFLWRASGKKKAAWGVVASGWLLEAPRVQLEDAAGRDLWKGRQETKGLRVWLAVDRVANAKEVVQAKWLLEDPILHDLRILRLRAETNYLVSEPHAARLTALWRNTGSDWNRAESIAGLWAYHHTAGGTVSQKAGSAVVAVAERIGRAVSGVYNKVMNFRAIDPRDTREGLKGTGATDRAVWVEFYDEQRQVVNGTALDAEFERLWPAGSQHEPESLSVEEAVTVTTGRGGQGFISDPAVRKAVEQRAMDLARNHYQAIFPVVKNTATMKPYDFSCLGRDGSEVRVEVKGSTGEAAEIRLTVGEVENARDRSRRTDLFLVTGIVVEQTPDGPRAPGGNVRIVEAWVPKADDLFPSVYRYRVPG
jgi:hypothetical protein